MAKGNNNHKVTYLEKTNYVKSKEPLKALNPRQAEYINAINTNSVIICTGVLGSSKTYIPSVMAADALSAKLCEKVIIARPSEGVGKGNGFLPGPQPYSSKVLTPTGWRLMGDLEVGDQIMASDGSITSIQNIFEKGVKDVYQINTLEGKATRACGDHLWMTKTQEELKRVKDFSIKTTQQIRDSLTAMKYVDNGEKREVYNHVLPRSGVMRFDVGSGIKISPYILGYLLGEGNLQGTPSIYTHLKDKDSLISKIRQEMDLYPLEGINITPLRGSGEDMTIIHFSSDLDNKRCYMVERNRPNGGVTIYNDVTEASLDLQLSVCTVQKYCRTEAPHPVTGDTLRYHERPTGKKYTNSLKNVLDEMGIIDCTGSAKHIPKNLIFGLTPYQRLELLRGLMDSDGSCSKTGEAIFCNSSFELIIGVQELVRSLGGRATYRNRGVRNPSVSKGRIIQSTKNSYELSISMDEDLNPFNLERKSTRYKTTKKTHDRIVSVDLVGRERVRCISIKHPSQLYVTDDYIVTHNTSDEKLAPWCQPIITTMKERMGTGHFEAMLENGRIELLDLSMAKGRSFDDTWLLIDEAEDIEVDVIKTLLTRQGVRSKMILTGDIAQQDLKKNSGLEYVLRVIKANNMPIATIDFDDWKYCVRSEEAKAWGMAFEDFERFYKDH